MTRSYVSSPMEEKIPATRVRSRHSHRRVERIFFTFQNRYFPPRRMERVQTFNFNTKSLLFDRRSMKGEKKKIGEIYDYSFARKENRFRLIRCFALRMFYISFDKIL